jgi:cell division protein FtsL
MRGRTVVFLALAGFVVLATGVVWRRSMGVTRARAIEQLESRRTALAAQRAKLDGDIRTAISMERLGRVAEERLHMRVPGDSLVVTLRRSPRVAVR